MGARLNFAASALLLSIALAADAGADIYKYVDDVGVIHFSNTPEAHHVERVVKENRQAKAGAPAPSFSAPPDKPAQETDASRYTEDDPADGPYAEIIAAKCRKYDVAPSLVRSIIKAESGFNPNAVSPKGASGLMQLMPATAGDMGVSDMFDPEQNIEGGVKYFRYLLDNFGGDVELSVAAYNCGQGRVIRNGNCVPDIKETKNYVKKVMSYTTDPDTGIQFSKTVYRIELKDGSVMFSDRPVPANVGLSIVE